MPNLKRDENTVISATLALLYEQAVSCHEDTAGPLWELALDEAAEAARGWKQDPIEISTEELIQALDTIMARCRSLAAKAEAARNLRGES
jgi:hypothetical protein